MITNENRLILGLKHHFLGNKGPVKAAGTLTIGKGKITEINNLSGHYKPALEEALRFPKIFKAANVKIRRANLKIFQFEENSKGYIIGNPKLFKTIEIKTLL